jgi:hypothetical protein
MNEVASLPPFCYPIKFEINLPLLLDSVEMLIEDLGLNLNEINEKCKKDFAFTINLTHLPGLKGPDRWKKYNGNHKSVKAQNISESDFTEHLLECQDLYIGQVIREIYKQHQGKFQGRAQLIWLGANSKYDFHRDMYTPNRYHVPLVTNKQCHWLFKNDSEICKLHMPADGRVWYLDPMNIFHTFVNDSSCARLHLLLTSGF